MSEQANKPQDKAPDPMAEKVAAAMQKAQESSTPPGDIPQQAGQLARDTDPASSGPPSNATAMSDVSVGSAVSAGVSPAATATSNNISGVSGPSDGPPSSAPTGPAPTVEPVSDGATVARMPLSPPAVRTSSVQERIKRIDEALKAAEDDESMARSDDLTLLRAQKQELEQIEARTVAGGNVLAPRSRLLDASDAQEKNPDKHVRWINTGDASRTTARQADGYSKLSEEQGGKKVGNLELFAIPKQQYAARVAGVRQRSAASFAEPQQQFEASMSEVAKFLRDKHGIKIKDSDLRAD